MSDLGNQYKNAVELADQLGMPRPVRPVARRRRRKRQRKSVADVATSLWDKLIPGTQIPTRESGIVPYARIPEGVRQKIPLSGPPIGWDPKRLEPDERALLFRLMAMGDSQRMGDIDDV